MDFENFRCLLYYQYVPIEDPAAIVEWQKKVCNDHNLNGRIRVSTEGINGTLTGSADGITAYIENMYNDKRMCAETIHWKLSGAVDRYPIESQCFQSLSIKVTKEVVSLDLTSEKRKELLKAGPGVHLTPEQFHEVIKESIEDDGIVKEENIALIDVRNVYETEIGRFEFKNAKGEMVSAMNPNTRQFSDFTKFIDENAEQLQKKKKVLMYCTGGVRCERASAYVKSKGIENVFQLWGGIHNYQESFPEGGFFKGKNFVYDPRIAVPSKESSEIIGKCKICDCLYDDYSAKIRCNRCRILLLVCESCRVTDEFFRKNGINCQNCNISDEKIEITN